MSRRRPRHRAGVAPAGLLDRVCWGLAPDEYEHVQRLRRELIADAETPFEHVVIASGDPQSGALDLAWLLADMDVWTFRLTRLWDGPAFTAVAGCGTLRGTRRWEPAVVQQCRWQLGIRTRARTIQRALTEPEMQAIATEIAERRHAAFKRAVDVVERRADDVVRDGILNLSRFPEAEPIVHAGSTLIASGLERRLRRLFYAQCADAENVEFLTAAVAAEVARVPEAVRAQTAARDDAEGAGIAWDEWVACHRRVLDAVAAWFGLPGHSYSVQVVAEPIVG